MSTIGQSSLTGAKRTGLIGNRIVGFNVTFVVHGFAARVCVPFFAGGIVNLFVRGIVGNLNPKLIGHGFRYGGFDFHGFLLLLVIAVTLVDPAILGPVGVLIGPLIGFKVGFFLPGAMVPGVQIIGG
jgi:hypothetical protein